MITKRDIEAIANLMIRRHGTQALTFAARAVEEMEFTGDRYRAEHWTRVRQLITESLDLALPATHPLSETVH